MELSDELLEQIGTYLSGQMAAADKERFEARIQQDTELREEVAIQREIKLGIGLISQKQRFKKMHADLETRGLLPAPEKPDSLDTPEAEIKVVQFPAKGSVFRSNLTYWAVAASLVFLIGLGWMFYRNQSDKQQLALNEQVFDSFFLPALKPAPITAADPDRVGAPQSPPPSVEDSVRLQAAVATLQQDRVPAAIEQLRPLAQGSPGHWSASAQWYLALAYLKNNQRKEARQMLNQIIVLTGHPYQSEAGTLLDQLNNSRQND